MKRNKTALTGKTLLKKVKETENLSKRATAKECGYYSVDKDGQIRVNMSEFYDALLAARGIVLNPEGSEDRRGREATYATTVHKNGQIVVGSAYTQEMGLRPGDELKIKLGYKHIQLSKVDAESAEDSE